VSGLYRTAAGRVDNTRGDALPKEQAHYLKEEPEPSVAIAVKGAVISRY
jgi:hypothetical protein